MLGSGRIDSKMYYYSYVMTNNGLIITKYPASKTYITEGETNPYVRTVEITCPLKITGYLLYEFEHTRVGRYEMHVPQGTIVQEFKL